MNYSDKELVRSFDFNDVHQVREMYKEVVINGRTYYKFGTAVATTVVGDLYKVNDPSNQSFNYVLLIGVARQHPCDAKVDSKKGTEIAAIYAKLKPAAVMQFQQELTWEEFKAIAEVYISNTPVQFVKTAEEIKASGDDVTRYNRANQTIKDSKYYNDYYEEYKKAFGDKDEKIYFRK